VDLHKFNFKMELRKDLGLDSLNVTAIITEVEDEFTTVFEDRVFEGVKTLEELVTIIHKD
jgi:acyl carrier protein